jgi:hypothetical protein
MTADDDSYYELENARAEASDLAAALQRVTAEVKTLKYERHVLLNGANYLARYGLSYFEKLCKKHKDDTCELIPIANSFIKEHDESKPLVVDWMTEMRDRAAAAEAQAANLRALLGEFRTYADGDKLPRRLREQIDDALAALTASPAERSTGQAGETK